MVYEGFGPTLAAEKLAEQDGFPPISRETLRLWLLKEGLWRRHRRRSPYRKRREPKLHFGELLQMDGSHHPCFGQEHNRSCLMNLVDDATGISLAMLSEQETTEAAIRNAPRAEEDLHVRLTARQDLRDIFCFEQLRSVGHAWVVRNENRFYQLLRGHEPLPRATSKVTVGT